MSGLFPQRKDKTIEKPNVISTKNLPIRINILAPVILWLLLDRLNAPGWIQGAAWTFVGVIYITLITGKFMEKQVDIFKKTVAKGD